MTFTYLVVEKNSTLKEVNVKNINKDELYKKCGFRKADGFECRTTWENIKIGHHKHTVQLWARDEGKPDSENKYEFPPPIDSKLYFGNCALIQIDQDENIISLSKELWLKIYEKLFGGFEEINEDDDEDDNDELENIKKQSKIKKTSYLKDGFVVDDSDEDEESVAESEKEEEESDQEDTETDDICKSDYNDEDALDEINGSELEEEEYDYDSGYYSNSD